MTKLSGKIQWDLSRGITLWELRGKTRKFSFYWKMEKSTDNYLAFNFERRLKLCTCNFRRWAENRALTLIAGVRCASAGESDFLRKSEAKPNRFFMTTGRYFYSRVIIIGKHRSRWRWQERWRLEGSSKVPEVTIGSSRSRVGRFLRSRSNDDESSRTRTTTALCVA